MRYERSVEDGRAETDWVGDGRHVINQLESAQIGSKHARSGAVTRVNYRVPLDQIDQGIVRTAIGKSSAQDEHVASPDPDDVSGIQEPHCIWVSKVGLGDFEAELREVDAFSFASFAADMDRGPVECVRHQHQPSNRAGELHQPIRMIT